MDCPEFLDRYSEFRDDEACTLPDRGAFEAHIDACLSCRRFDRVFERGVALLTDTHEPDFREDFRERLQHRLYLAEFEGRRRRRFGNSAPLTVGLAAAAVLTVVATWTSISEAVVSEPSLTLPPITARVPDAQIRRASVPNPGANRAVSPLQYPDYWSDAHTLLFEHSPLYARNRAGGMVRTGIQ